MSQSAAKVIGDRGGTGYLGGLSAVCPTNHKPAEGRPVSVAWATMDRMTDMPEPGRQAAHILLDMASAFDWDHPDDPANTAAMNLAFIRMNEVKAVTATIDDETDELHIDMSNLIGGAAVAANWLVLLCAELSKGALTSHDVIVRLREFLNSDT